MGDTAPTTTFDRALALVRFLREHCDWDARQTPRSLLPYLLEEAHEAAEAVAREDDAALLDELGDLLLNIAFQAVLAEERAAFTPADVIEQLEAKMRRRHPHLYGDGPAVEWERLKAIERSSTKAAGSILDGLATGLDPLSRAQRVQDRASGIGFDWNEAGGALQKVREETEELAALMREGSSDRVEEEIGDLLFAVVNVARLMDAHAMLALQRANAKFERRFRGIERLAAERGIDLANASLAAMDTLWDEIKQAERSRATGTDD